MKIVLASLLALTLFPGVAHASLIGDEVDIRVRLPFFNDLDQTQSTTVTADASDALVFDWGSNALLTVDPFAGGFVITNTGSGGFSPSTGHFFEFTSLDFTPSGVVSDVDFTNDLFSLSGAVSSPTGASVRMDITGPTNWFVGESITVNIDSEVPEPTSLALLGLGGLIVARRRR